MRTKFCTNEHFDLMTSELLAKGKIHIIFMCKMDKMDRLFQYSS